MSENNKALATVDPNVFLTFDRLDDDQIIAEMKGAALQEYVYEFTEGGQQVRGLSKAGTDDASRIMAVKYGEALREIDVILESQTEDEALFKAKVERWVIRDDGTPMQMDSAIGQKRQGKKLVRRDGKVIPNSFWYEQGGQKALRNAKQKLMPETIKQAIIAAYIEQGKVRKVKPEDIAPAESNGQTTEQEHWCPIHNVPFRRQQSRSDPNKHWYSHKDGDEWCNESKARDVEPEQPKSNSKPEPVKAGPGAENSPYQKPADPPTPALWKRWEDLWNEAQQLGIEFEGVTPDISKADLIAKGQALKAKIDAWHDKPRTRVDHEPIDQRPDTVEDGADVPGIDELEADAVQAGVGL